MTCVFVEQLFSKIEQTKFFVVIFQLFAFRELRDLKVDQFLRSLFGAWPAQKRCPSPKFYFLVVRVVFVWGTHSFWVLRTGPHFSSGVSEDQQFGVQMFLIWRATSSQAGDDASGMCGVPALTAWPVGGSLGIAPCSNRLTPVGQGPACSHSSLCFVRRVHACFRICMRARVDIL